MKIIPVDAGNGFVVLAPDQGSLRSPSKWMKRSDFREFGFRVDLLAYAAGIRSSSSFFTVGLFSTLDALLSAPMERVVKKLPLTQEVQDALLDGRGPLGEALRCTLAYERGDWDAVACFSLPRSAIKQAFIDPVVWVEAADQEIAAVGA